MKDVYFRRMVVVGGFCAVCVIVLLYRLIHIQVIEHASLSREALHQQTSRADTHVSRGTIYFTTKNGEYISAATLEHGAVVALDTTRVQNVSDVARALSESGADVSIETLEKHVRSSRSKFEVILEGIRPDIATSIRAAAVPGIVVAPSSWRQYPGQSRAAHVLGFVSYTGDERSGTMGLERQYEDVLRRDDTALTKNFFADLFSDTHEIVRGETVLRGDIITSIEPTVQAELERILSVVREEWTSRETWGIVMDASTGRIVAMARTPDFNPNTFRTADPSTFKNPLVESVHEMGSIVKVLTYAVGIDSGAITEKSTYTDTATATLNGKTFGNFDGKGRGVVLVQEVLRQSLNVGAAHIAQRIGNTKMREYFLDILRIGEETGIDLPGEVNGITDNLESSRPIEFATASFGQGIATTPIATLRALTAAANGGMLVVPHLVTSIEYPGGVRRELAYDDQIVRVFAPETSLAVSRVLASIVDEKLDNGKLRLPNHTVAAKTGTAQIPRPGGGYYSDKYLHTFFGYVPAYQPRYVILLGNNEPHGAKYSSETLAKPFMGLVSFLTNYYAIPPDR